MAIANLWKELLANVQRMPQQIQVGLDWTRIFMWAAQQAGLKNIYQFRTQVVPDAAVLAAAERGNVVPIRGNQPRAPAGPALAGVQPGAAASTAAGLETLGAPEY
jgi:hypothetical protein